MREIDVEQGSQEWHDFRQNHIGASDAAPIQGLSPYKTRQELWKEKMGLSSGQVKTSAMQRGNALEPIVRKMMSENLDCQLVTKVFVSEKRPWMACSVDGIDLEKGIVVEIKCANHHDHELARQNFVPTKYFPQLQHILEVCDIDVIWYCSYHKDELLYFAVDRLECYVKDMVNEEMEFWCSLQSFKKPEINEKHKEYTKEPKNYIERNDEEWKHLALLLKETQDTKRHLQTKEDGLKSALISMSGESNARGHGLKLTQRSRIGSVDYAAITELMDLDVEPYRKPSTQYWMFENE